MPKSPIKPSPDQGVQEVIDFVTSEITTEFAQELKDLLAQKWDDLKLNLKMLTDMNVFSGIFWDVMPPRKARFSEEEIAKGIEHLFFALTCFKLAGKAPYTLYGENGDRLF